MRRQDAPVPHTCPTINKVVEFMRALKNIPEVVEQLNAGEIDEMLDHLEDIRVANDSLRDWGYINGKEADHEEALKDEAHSKIEDLELEVSRLNCLIE